MPPCLNYLELFNSWLCCTSISSYWWSYRSPEVSISNTEIDWLHSTCRDWPRAQAFSWSKSRKKRGSKRLKFLTSHAMGKTCRSHSIAGWFCKQVVERIGGSRCWWSHDAWIKNHFWPVESCNFPPIYAVGSHGSQFFWIARLVFFQRTAQCEERQPRRSHFWRPAASLHRATCWMTQVAQGENVGMKSLLSQRESLAHSTIPKGAKAINRLYHEQLQICTSMTIDFCQPIPSADLCLNCNFWTVELEPGSTHHIHKVLANTHIVNVTNWQPSFWLSWILQNRGRQATRCNKYLQLPTTSFKWIGTTTISLPFLVPFKLWWVLSGFCKQKFLQALAKPVACSLKGHGNCPWVFS